MGRKSRLRLVTSEEHAQPLKGVEWDRRWLSLATIALIAGALVVGRLSVPGPPHDTSVAAGFTRDMSALDDQAAWMAEILHERSLDPAVREIATRIVLDRQSEAGQLRGWLDIWGLERSGSEPRQAWMGHPAGTVAGLPGMASPESLTRLEQLSGAALDEEFLRLMIRNYQLAVGMSQAALGRSTSPEVRRLAEDAVAPRRTDIGTMQQLLAQKGVPPVEGEFDAERPDSHDGDGGFATSAGTGIRDTLQLAPIILAVFAAAWLAIDLVRRRAGWRAAELEAADRVWQAVAVAGLIASAFLHMGLVPAQFEASAVNGVLFAAAAVGLASVSAAVLTWPSPPTYLAGAAVSLVLVLVYLLFQFVPPPSSDTSPPFTLIGVMAKVAELGALVTCFVLWQKGRHHGTKASSPRAARRRAQRATIQR